MGEGGGRPDSAKWVYVVEDQTTKMVKVVEDKTAQDCEGSGTPDSVKLV